MIEHEQDATSQIVQAQRQFDFWIGEWDLTWADGGRGTNNIRPILDGHVILEQFDASPVEPFEGMSVSVYNSLTGCWQQTWVDNLGNYLDFTGTFQDGKMTLARTFTVAGKTIMQRMVFYNISDAALDWDWERSEDLGATWNLQWHIHYERKVADGNQ